jgi:hypothetical protein
MGVEDSKLLPHDPPDGEQWRDDQRASLGRPVTKAGC